MIAWVVRKFAAWRQRENVRIANDAFSTGEWRMLRAEYWAGVIWRWREKK